MDTSLNHLNTDLYNYFERNKKSFKVNLNSLKYLCPIFKGLLRVYIELLKDRIFNKSECLIEPVTSVVVNP